MNGMNGDRLIRMTTAAVVVAVAAFAAVVSFSHIYDLGRLHGQSGTAARLLPLSVDGLIVAASLVLLHEARNGRGAPALARWMLWLGVGATLGANAAYGAPFGALGVLVSTWPAIAFVGAVELLMGLVRRARPQARQETAEMTPEADAQDDAPAEPASDAQPEPVPDAQPTPVIDAQPSPPPARRSGTRKGVTGRDKVKRILTAHPDMPRAEVARKAGVSESTVDRVKRDTNGSILAGFNGHARG